MGSLRTPHKTHRARLQLEQLEDRLVPAGIQPTGLEQLMLEQLNDARANPAAYGQSIGLDLSTVAPSQPLAFDPRLIASALGHSQDMSSHNYFGHIDSQGLDPGQRIANQGYTYSDWAESIAAGYTTTADALAGLIIDNGVPGLGHRLQLLSIGSSYQTQTQVGIGIVMNGAGQYADYYTIDTAAPQGGGVFLTGAVFNDQNGNGKYDIGEGLAGVTISVQGGGATTSFDSGGYTLQVAPGTYSVTASGGGLAAPITQTVTVGSRNARLEFFAGGNTLSPAQHAADAAFVSQLYLTDLKRAASTDEVNTFGTMLDLGQATPASLTNMVKSSQEYQNVCTIWLQQAYTDMLGRPISQGETSAWMQSLKGSGSLDAVAHIIVTSQEYHLRQWAGWVQDVYATYLHRSADPGEVAGWMPALEAGWTRDNLVAAAVGSAEYQNRVGATSDQFVAGLYQDMLGRAAGTAEIGSWVALLNNNASRGEVLSDFLASPEYRWRQATLWSAQLYSSLLARQAGAQELNNLATALTSGATCENTAVGVLDSQEYYNRAASNYH